MRRRAPRQRWRQLGWFVSCFILVPADDPRVKNTDGEAYEDLCADVPCPENSVCFVVAEGTGNNGSATVCFADTAYFLGNTCSDTRCPRPAAEGMECTMWPPDIPYSQRRPACKYCHIVRTDQTRVSCITTNVCEYAYPQNNVPPCTLGGAARSTVDLKADDEGASIDVALLAGIAGGAMLGCFCLVMCFVWSLRSNPADDGPEVSNQDRDQEAPGKNAPKVWGTKKGEDSGPRITHREKDEACDSDYLAHFVHEHHGDHDSMPHEGPLHMRMSHHQERVQPSAHSARREVEAKDRRSPSKENNASPRAMAPVTSAKSPRKDMAKMVHEVSDQGTLARMAGANDGYKYGDNGHGRMIAGAGKVAEQHYHGSDVAPTQSAAAARAMAEMIAQPPAPPAPPGPNSHHHHHRKADADFKVIEVRGRDTPATPNPPDPIVTQSDSAVSKKASSPNRSPRGGSPRRKSKDKVPNPLGAAASAPAPVHATLSTPSTVAAASSLPGAKGPSPRDMAVVAIAEAAEAASMAAAASAKAVAAVAAAQAARDEEHQPRAASKERKHHSPRRK